MGFNSAFKGLTVAQLGTGTNNQSPKRLRERYTGPQNLRTLVITPAVTFDKRWKTDRPTGRLL
jgi:hypothetical protein